MGDSPYPPRIVDQLATQAPFLWRLRDRAVHSPRYDLNALAALDARLDAHLEALAQVHAEDLALHARVLDERLPEGLFVLTQIACRHGKTDTVMKLAEAAQENALWRSFVAALSWVPGPFVEKIAARLLAPSAGPAQQAAGLAVATKHGLDLRGALPAALRSSHSLLTAQALRTIGEAALLPFAGALPTFFEHDDEALRYQAGKSALLLGTVPEAKRVLHRVAVAQGPFAEQAARLAAVDSQQKDWAHWRAAAQCSSEQQRLLLCSAGAWGDLTAVPWLLRAMPDPQLARAAGEAFCTLTGADLARDQLESDTPDPVAGAPSPDPADPRVALPDDFDLAQPDPEKVSAWWRVQEPRFEPGVPYFLGEVRGTVSLQSALRRGTQRQRQLAAMLLSAGSPGLRLFPVEAPGFRQKQMLSS